MTIIAELCVFGAYLVYNYVNRKKIVHYPVYKSNNIYFLGSAHSNDIDTITPEVKEIVYDCDELFGGYTYR
jgi:hypothetical protein